MMGKEKKGVDNPGTYVGLHTKGQLPKTTIHTRKGYSRTHRGKEVEVLQVWVKDRNQIRPVFQEDEEPRPQKISLLTRLFRAWFGHE